MKLIKLLCMLLTATMLYGADTPTPTVEQRVGSIEAYLSNTDPTSPLKGSDGKIAEGLTTVAASNTGPGHNGFQMISTALVLFMTLPGLFLFYGGLVRRKNMLSVVAQCFGIAGIVTILWYLFGYSFIFGDGSSAWWGSFSKFAFLDGVTSSPNTNYAYWISQNVFSIFQMMFAIITPALIIGAIAERMKFSAILLFTALWMCLVYFPLAHWVWGIDGALNGVWNANAIVKSIDFAGGTVVHMSSGWSALLLCLLLGKRIGYGKQPMTPHSMTLCAIGTGMLWVGWYGFNAGSALAANGIAALAFINTQVATGAALIGWLLVEKIRDGHATSLGAASGAVAGLVAITPACAFVAPWAAVVLGLLAGIFCALAVGLKYKFGFDDSLDVVGVHLVGGLWGCLSIGFFATKHVNSLGGEGLLYGGGTHLLGVQAFGAFFVMAYSFLVTLVLGFIINKTIGFRISQEAEITGIDFAEHRETAYELFNSSRGGTSL